MIKKRIPFILVIALLLVPLSAFIHLSTGEIYVSLNDFFSAIFEFKGNNSSHVLIREFKIPRILIAVVAGGGLALSGMLMQTLFNNPLAGPYVLGINSGASLLVALSLMSGFSFFGSDIGLNDGLPIAFGQAWSQTVVFTILIIILVFKPAGLLGKVTMEKV